MKRIFISLLMLSLWSSLGRTQDTLVVNFKFDSDVLSPVDQAKINMFAKKHMNAHYSFYGYCDTVGSIVYNLDLAHRRIVSVQKALGGVNITSEDPIGESQEFTVMGKNRAVKLIAYDPVIRETAMGSVLFDKNKEVLDTIRLKIEFWGGTADVKEYSLPELYLLYDQIKEAADVNLEIHGHVCCDDDMALSIARAKRVRDYLAHKGIDMDRMTYEGHSNYIPKVPEISEENMQMNRRVEVVLYRKLK